MIGKNIIELQNELSYMPMEKLVSLVDDPNSMYGSLTLIEIQNRKALTDNAKSSQPIPTVAEDILSSVTSPPSLDSSSPTSLDQTSGGIADIPRDELMGESTISPIEQLRKKYGYQNQEEFDKEKRMLMLMQLGSNIAKAEDFSDVVEGNQDIFTTRMALDKQRREDDMGLATLSSKLNLFDTSDVSNIATALEKARADGADIAEVGTKARDDYEALSEYYRYLISTAPTNKSGGLGITKADLSPVAPSGV